MPDIHEILRETTQQFRKGAVIHGTPELVDAIAAMSPEGDLPNVGGTVTFDMMPKVPAPAENVKLVDLHFIQVGVDMAKAEAWRADLTEWLNAHAADFRDGPSYIAVGGVLGDQGLALQLFALGSALGLWQVITPEAFGMTGAEADNAAGLGFVMISGYRPA